MYVKQKEESDIYSNIFDVNVLETLQNSELKIAPNPASGNFIINFSCISSTKSAQLLITDVMGRNVKAIKLPATNGSVSLNTAELGARGIYYIILQEDGMITKTSKLVIQ